MDTTLRRDYFGIDHRADVLSTLRGIAADPIHEAKARAEASGMARSVAAGEPLPQHVNTWCMAQLVTALRDVYDTPIERLGFVRDSTWSPFVGARAVATLGGLERAGLSVLAESVRTAMASRDATALLSALRHAPREHTLPREKLNTMRLHEAGLHT